MALFRYRALTTEGKKIAGVIDADSYALAKERLVKQEVMITHLASFQQSKKEEALTPAVLLAFTRELAQLLRAGLPLYESLLTIEEKYRRHPSHPLFLGLCDQLKAGSLLSLALKKYPKSFDEIYLSLVQTGEETGSIAQIFEQLTDLISKKQRLKKQLLSALTYPAFLGSFCFLVIIALFFFVIPSMQELFEGRHLHPLTSIILGISRFLNQNSLSLGLCLLSSGALGFLFLRRNKNQIILKLSLKLPYLKTIVVQSALIRFCRASSLLLTGGVPLIQALSLSRKTMNHSLLEEIIERAEKKIIEGERFSVQLKGSPLIPSLVVRMLSIAEETGKLGPMLGNIADIYDEELEKSLSQMTSLLQPLLLLTLGGIVGLVILSILLPLTDVGSFLST
jgi:general secretion pathway protein F